MDVPEKTKDNVKSRMNVTDICDREELHLQPSRSGKAIKPKRSSFLLWIKEESCVNG